MIQELLPSTYITLIIEIMCLTKTTSPVRKVIDTLTQEDFHGAFQKLLEWYKCIAAGGDYFKGD